MLMPKEVFFPKLTFYIPIDTLWTMAASKINISKNKESLIMDDAIPFIKQLHPILEATKDVSVFLDETRNFEINTITLLKDKKEMHITCHNISFTSVFPLVLTDFQLFVYAHLTKSKTLLRKG